MHAQRALRSPPASSSTRANLVLRKKKNTHTRTRQDPLTRTHNTRIYINYAGNSPVQSYSSSAKNKHSTVPTWVLMSSKKQSSSGGPKSAESLGASSNGASSSAARVPPRPFRCGGHTLVAVSRLRSGPLPCVSVPARRPEQRATENELFAVFSFQFFIFDVETKMTCGWRGVASRGVQCHYPRRCYREAGHSARQSAWRLE